MPAPRHIPLNVAQIYYRRRASEVLLVVWLKGEFWADRRDAATKGAAG